MSEHMPGPWTYHRTAPPEITRFLVYGIEGPIGPGHIARCTNEANARLIAASPTMYKLLKAWEEWEGKLILEARANALEFMSTELYDEMLSLQIQRNDAIAKAEGRS